MIRKVPFEPGHLRNLMQRDTTGTLAKNEYPSFMKMISEESYSCVNDKGEAVAIFGVEKRNAHRAEAWLVSQTLTPKESVSTFRIMKRALEGSSIPRIECVVDCDNTQGHKLVRALGFNLECERLPHYLPNGNAASLYSYIRER